MSIHVFFSYAHKDEKYKDELLNHLRVLQKEKYIDGWDDRKIIPGGEWESEINLNIQSSQIILLLVSSNFLASDYCYDTETIFALEQQEKNLATVMPIIIKPCLWKKSHFKHLQALPKDGKPISIWRNRDLAWVDVSEGILKTIENFPKFKSLDDLMYNNYKIIDYHKRNMVDEIMKKKEDLIYFIFRLLSLHNEFYFSPLKIKKIVSESEYFKELSNSDIKTIKSELEELYKMDLVKVIKNKKGDFIYKFNF
jgi:hypothetical protein